MCIDRSIVLKETFDWARMIVHYTDIVNKGKVNHRGVGWIESELSKLSSETKEVKRVV